ncbi:MAG: hypothetical protein V1754_10400 [Pseudomonadota bacterium]
MNSDTLGKRESLILKARNQKWTSSEQTAALAKLRLMRVGSPSFLREVSVMPAQVRTAFFVEKAKAAGKRATAFPKRLRGMLIVGNKKTAVDREKTFVEVTSRNFDLFRAIAGQNMLWFAFGRRATHLHTLITDQGGGTRFHHNTYGYNTNRAMPSFDAQLAMGVHLTDAEMDRFVRYMNAASKAQEKDNHSNSVERELLKVFGFYSKGRKITDIECTNWATSAPIGDLPAWANTVNQQVMNAAIAGQLRTVPEISATGGLHEALATAKDKDTRASIVQKLLAVQNSRLDKKAITRMAKAFDQETTDFPRRPHDLVLRQSLATSLGLKRSKDPAKWAFDLLLHKHVPVLAIIGQEKDPIVWTKTFEFRNMGLVDAEGKTTKLNFGKNLGVVSKRSR